MQSQEKGVVTTSDLNPHLISNSPGHFGAAFSPVRVEANLNLEQLHVCVAITDVFPDFPQETRDHGEPHCFTLSPNQTMQVITSQVSTKLCSSDFHYSFNTTIK